MKGSNIGNDIKQGVDVGATVERNTALDAAIKFSNRYKVECFDRHGNLKWADHIDNVVVDVGVNDVLDKYYKGSSYTAAHYVGLIGANAGTVAITSGAAAITGSGTSFQAADVGSDLIIAGAGASGADLSTTLSARSSTTAATSAANAGTTVSGAAYAIEPRAADTMSSKSFNEDASYSNSVRPTLTMGTVAAKSVDNSASKAVFTINAAARIFGAFVTTNSTKSGTTGTLVGGGLFSGGSKLVDNGDTLNVTITATGAST
jgi:hypothetical protein